MKLAAVILLIAVSTAQAVPRVILGSGSQVKGTAIRADEDGTIYLTTPESVMTFPPGTTAIVDEPAAYRTALGHLQRKNYTEAIKELRNVITDFKFLTWDRKAEQLMAAALLGNGNYGAAVMTYDRVFEHSPEARDDPRTWLSYLEALFAAEQYDKLEPVLDATVMERDRNLAAAAQIMRGKINLKAGKVEAALFDFIRTAELFGDVPEFQAEAYFRAGVCFEKLGDQRSRDFFLKVKDDFADSPFAIEARSR